MAILATCDLSSGQWVFDSNVDSSAFDFQIGFAKNGSRLIDFADLKFGFDVSVNGVDAGSFGYPRQGEKYLSSDQIYITSQRLSFNFDDDVAFSVWAEENGSTHADVYSLTIPRPDKPYESWLWEGDWVPPVAYPEDGGFYRWDEESLSWATVDLNIEQGDS